MPADEAGAPAHGSAAAAADAAPPRGGSVHVLPLPARPAQRRRHLALPLRLAVIALAGAVVGGTASVLLRKLGL